MGLRILRVLVAAALLASGALMYAASSERWAGACAWTGDDDVRGCEIVQDHLYDFLPPEAPWEPIGSAAQLGGISLMVLAGALLPLSWALTGRRPGALLLIGVVGAALATLSIGVAAWRSGVRGEVVVAYSTGTSLFGWLLVLLGVYVWWAVAGAGWTRAAAILLVVSSPLVAAFSYAIGSFDARPWYEAVSGIFLAAAGVCVLLSAVWRSAHNRDAVRTSPATPVDVL